MYLNTGRHLAGAIPDACHYTVTTCSHQYKMCLLDTVPLIAMVPVNC